MNPNSDQPKRSAARNYLRAGGALAAALLALNLVAAVRHKSDSAFAAPAGALTIVKGVNPGAGGLLTSGGSAEVFALQPPAAAACAGDGTKGFRIQTFLVSNSVNIDTMAFDAGGPSRSSLNLSDFAVLPAHAVHYGGDPAATPARRLRPSQT